MLSRQKLPNFILFYYWLLGCKFQDFQLNKTTYIHTRPSHAPVHIHLTTPSRKKYSHKLQTATKDSFKQNNNMCTIVHFIDTYF